MKPAPAATPAPSFLDAPQDWDARLDARANPNPFITADWLGSWWRHFGTDSAPWLVLAPGHGDFAVLRCAWEQFSGVPVRMARLLVNGHCSRASLACFGPPEALAQAWMLEMQRLRSNWDCARLDGLPAEGGLVEAILEQARALGLRPAVQRRWSHTWMPIRGRWDERVRAMSRNERKHLGRTGRRLQELGQVRWQQCREPGDIMLAFDAFLAMESRSWKAGGGEIIASRPEVEGFYRSVVTRFAARGQAVVDLFHLDSRLISAVFSICHGRQQFLLKGSYDEAFATLSPSWHLFQHLLKDAFDRQQLDAIDFCGRRPFTEMWSDQSQSFCDLVIFSPTVIGRAVWLGQGAREHWRRLRLPRETPPSRQESVQGA